MPALHIKDVSAEYAKKRKEEEAKKTQAQARIESDEQVKRLSRELDIAKRKLNDLKVIGDRYRATEASLNAHIIETELAQRKLVVLHGENTRAYSVDVQKQYAALEDRLRHLKESLNKL
jgi:hypothetical protein